MLRSLFSIRTGCYSEASCCSLRYIFKNSSSNPNARSRNKKWRRPQMLKRRLITSPDKSEDFGSYIIFPAKSMEFHQSHLEIGAWTSSLLHLITFLFIWLMSALDWVLEVVSLVWGLLILGRIAKTILQGHGEREVSGVDLDKAIQEFNSELVTFGTSIGFRTFDTVHGTTLYYLV